MRSVALALLVAACGGSVELRTEGAPASESLDAGDAGCTTEAGKRAYRACVDLEDDATR